MTMDEWFDRLTDEQKQAVSGLGENELMDYLAEQNLELPDEMLEGVAGGINPFAILYQMLSRKFK